MAGDPGPTDERQRRLAGGPRRDRARARTAGDLLRRRMAGALSRPGAGARGHAPEDDRKRKDPALTKSHRRYPGLLRDDRPTAGPFSRNPSRPRRSRRQAGREDRRDPDDPPAAARPSSSQGTTAAGANDDKTTPGAGGIGRPRIGQRVRYIGDYEVISVLGQGGMGVVYKARQISLNRPVALKMIRNAEFAGDDQVRRFQNEAEAVATLDHPGIVPIYEVGQYEDRRYFSMKLIEGAGLDKHLDRPRDQAPRGRDAVVAEVADAVYHAHQRGILHRDLKPANILLDGQGQPHVTDFGLAKRIEGDDGPDRLRRDHGHARVHGPRAGRSGGPARSRRPPTSTAWGRSSTPPLTGRAPFAGDSVLETLEQVRQRARRSRPAARNARLPRDLEVICLKCLEKDPRHRYASAGALADDLRPLARRRADRRPAGRPVPSAPGCGQAQAGAGGARGGARRGLDRRGRRRHAAVARGRVPAQPGPVRTATTPCASEKAAAQGRGRSQGRPRRRRRQREDAVAARTRPSRTPRSPACRPRWRSTRSRTLDHARSREAPGARPLRASRRPARLRPEADRRRRRHLREVHQQGGHHRGGAHGARQDLPAARPDREGLPDVQKCLEIAKERIKIKNNSDPSRQNLANTYFELAFCSEELNRDMKAALGYNQDGLKLYEDIYNNPKLDDFPLDRKVVARRPGRGLYPRGRHPVSDGRAHRRARGISQGIQPPTRAGRRDEGQPTAQARPQLLADGPGRDELPPGRSRRWPTTSTGGSRAARGDGPI